MSLFDYPTILIVLLDFRRRTKFPTVQFGIEKLFEIYFRSLVGFEVNLDGRILENSEQSKKFIELNFLFDFP